MFENDGPDKILAAAISMHAVGPQRAVEEGSFDVVTVELPGGVQLAHVCVFQFYPEPLSHYDARARALKACENLYPISQGWRNHSVSVADIDQEVIERLRPAFTATVA